MSRSWRSRLEDILDAANTITRYVAAHDRESFLADDQAVDAVAFNLLAIREAAAHVPPQVQERAPDIPRHQMRAMRNVLVHEYFQVDAGVIWATATTSLPPVLDALRNVLDEDKA